MGVMGETQGRMDKWQGKEGKTLRSKPWWQRAVNPAMLRPGMAWHGDTCAAQFKGWACFQAGDVWKKMKQFGSTGLTGHLWHREGNKAQGKEKLEHKWQQARTRAGSRWSKSIP